MGAEVRAARPLAAAAAAAAAFCLAACGGGGGGGRAAPSVGVTERVSVSSAGAQADSLSTGAAVSADGEIVAFWGLAANLVAGDTNLFPDVFVRDRAAGETARVSVGPGGAQGDGQSDKPVLSADGRFVAFCSHATTLVASDGNAVQDIFLYDRVSGALTRASVAAGGGEANGASGYPALNEDGSVLAFQTAASNLAPGDGNGRIDIVLKDLASGAVEMVSQATDGTLSNGFSDDPSVSADGRFVAYWSLASNLVAGDGNLASDVFLRDRAMGTTERLSVSSGGAEGDGPSETPAVSADGTVVAFASDATNLVAGDANGEPDIFVRDLAAGTTERVSVSSEGLEADGGSLRPAVSADGRFVAFWSLASNLVAGDANGAADVFIHDRATGATERVSVSSAGLEGNADSLGPAVSGDGRYVAFASDASNLVAGDTNRAGDVFLRDRETP